MKKLLFILLVTIGLLACNNYEEEGFHDCVSRYGQDYDTVHVQSAPNAAEDLYNLGYDTTKALVILPGGMQ